MHFWYKLQSLFSTPPSWTKTLPDIAKTQSNEIFTTGEQNIHTFYRYYLVIFQN